MSVSPETEDNPKQPPEPQTKDNVTEWSQVLGFMAALTAILPPFGGFFGAIAFLLAMISILRRRWGREAFDGLMGGAIGLGFTVLIFSIGLPIWQRSMDQARRIYCQNNAAIISRAVNAYASEGNTAPSQPALMPSDKPWQCPFNRKLAVGYFYLPPAPGAPNTTIVVCDYFANHKGTGRSVGYLSDWSKWRTEQEFQQELQRPENREFAEALRQSPIEQQR